MTLCRRYVPLVVFISLSLNFYSALPSAWARDIRLVPSLSMTGEYNDNVLFTRADKMDDFIISFTPALTLDVNTELLHLDTSVAVDIDRYVDETDLDTVKQRYNLNAAYRFRPRWNLSGLFSYIKDTTLDALLDETGILIRREDRKRLDAGGGFTHQLSELSDLGVNYVFTQVDYDSSDSVDYDRHAVSLSYDRKLINQRDTVSVLPSYIYRNSDVSRLDEVSLAFAWRHLFSPIFHLYALVGVRYTDQDFKDDSGRATDWGVIANIYLQREEEVYSFYVGYRRDVRTSPRGRGIEVDRLYGSIRRDVTRRLALEFLGEIFFTRDLDESFNTDSRFFRLTPSLKFKITENHFLRLAYSYDNDYDKNLEDDRMADRNRVWLTLTFNFPKSW